MEKKKKKNSRETARRRKEKRKEEEDGTCSSDHVISLKLERRGRRRGRLLIEPATPSLAARVSKLAFSLSRLQVSDYFGNVGAFAPFSFGFPLVSLSKAQAIWPREHFCTFDCPPLFNVPSSDGLSDFFFYYANYNRRGFHPSCHSSVSVRFSLKFIAPFGK